MSYTPVKIDDHLHEKMKQLAGDKRGAIAAEYREAIQEHIKYKTEENMVRDTGLDNFINNRVTKAEDHLSSMMARTGIDTSITLMGVILLLEKLLKVDKSEIIKQLRHDGYLYFSTVIKEDKENKKSNN